MSHLNQNVKAAIDQSATAADVSENVGEFIRAVADGASTAAHQVRGAAGRAVEAVEQKYERVSHAARDSFQHGRDLGRRWEDDFEGAIRSRPLISVLIAAGIGLVVGTLWHRR